MQRPRNVVAIALAALMLVQLAVLSGCAWGKDASGASETPVSTEGLITPAPTAAPLDMSVYSIDAENGLYDVYPLCAAEGMELVCCGFRANGLLALLHASTDGSSVRAGVISLSSGEYTMLAEVFSEDAEFTTSPQAYQLTSVEPFSFVFFDVFYKLCDDGTSCKYDVPDGASYGATLISDGRLFVFDSLTGELLTIDTTDPAAHSVRVASVGYQYLYARMTSVTSDGSYASFSAVDIYGGDVSFILDIKSSSVALQNAGRLYFDEYNGEFYAMDIQTEWDENAVCQSTMTLRRSASMLDCDVAQSVFQLDDALVLEVFTSPEYGRFTFCDDNGENEYRLYAADYSGADCRCVDVDYMSLNTALGGYMASPALDRFSCGGANGGDVIVPLTLGFSTKALILWRWDESAGAEAPQVSASSFVGNIADSPRTQTDYGEVSAYAAEIEKKYGVTVLLGADTAIDLDPFSAEPLTDTEKMLAVLQILDDNLGMYPEGFFDALCSGYLSTVAFLMVGPIRGSSPNVVSTPTAFTLERGYVRIVAIDASTAGAEFVIYHEISHIIDSKLNSAYAEAHGITVDWSESGWMQLNPTGFNYYNAYNSPEGFPYIAVGTPDYTPEWYRYDVEHDVDSVYFMDKYSKTFSTEDRATLFQNIMTYSSSMTYMRSVNVIAKAQYYFNAIRQLLDPNGCWTEPTAWETMLARLMG